MHTRLELATEQHPGRLAVIHGDRTLTYAGLHRHVQRFAAGLLDSGIAPGQPIVLSLSNGPEFVIAYLAASSIGACAVTLDPALPAAALRETVAHVRPFAVVADGQDPQKTAQPDPGEAALQITATGDPYPGTVAFAEIVKLGHTARTAGPAGRSELLARLYTSGTTGVEQLIGRSRANQLAEGRNIATTCDITGADVVLCAVPLFHALGQYCCLAVSIFAGATLVLLDRPSGGRGRPSFADGCPHLLDLVKRHRVTVLPLVPAALDALSRTRRTPGEDVSSLRYVTSGSTFLDDTVTAAFRARFGLPIRQTYGSTEVGTVAWNCGPAEELCAGSVGRPLEGVAVRVVDDRGHQVANGTDGEIAVGGEAVSAAAHLPAEQRCLPGGWTLTGDIGRLDAAGRLFVVGRKRLIIETRGHKVNPRDVETTLLGHPCVADVAVVPEQVRGQTLLVALVVGRDGCRSEDLVDYCAQRLPFYMAPAEVRLRSSLPRNRLGKLLRHRLSG